jgi:DUF1365 family protein
VSASCLYEGTIRHRRRERPGGEFRHRVFMAYLDLDELPGRLDYGGLASARHAALASFRRADYLGNPEIPLGEAVRDLVRARTGRRLGGPVRLLTQLRCYGLCFNPVSFYYCFDRAGEHVQAVVAEVTNTPWGERHAYVLEAGPATNHGTPRVLKGRLEKALHVSPLLAMESTYELRLSEPGERLSVHIASSDRDERRLFDATLALQRRELEAGALGSMLARYPFPTARVLGLIYWHALRLRLRGARYFPHPPPPAVSP